MAGTNSSKIRHGGTLERKKNLGLGGSSVNLAKENPGQEASKSKGFSSVSNKLGTGYVNSCINNSKWISNDCNST